MKRSPRCEGRALQTATSIHFRRGARRRREAKVASCQRLLATAEALEQFGLPLLRSRVGRLGIEGRAQEPLALREHARIARICGYIDELFGICGEIE